MLFIKTEQRNNKGFTLIELLVVIAIIGLLGGVISVFTSNARDRAKAAKIMADLVEISKALKIYLIDSGIGPPHDHSWNDECERAALGSGDFEPKPDGWNGPYISWPDTSPGNEYHWELSGSTPYLSVRNVSREVAELIDAGSDDDNLLRGNVLWNNGRLDYYKEFRDYPKNEEHFAFCGS